MKYLCADESPHTLCSQHERAAEDPRAGSKSALLDIPINTHVLCLAANGDDIDAAVAVQVRGCQIFDGDATGIDELARPLGAALIQDLVNAYATPFLTAVVTYTDDQLVDAVAVEVRRPNGMAPFQFLVNDMPVHHR